MARQQLLLVLLGLLIVAIAVGLGVYVFVDESASENREAVVNDLIVLGTRAQRYYRTTPAEGGGGNSFQGLTDIGMLTDEPLNANGTYTLANALTHVTITGTGTATGRDGNNPVRVVMQVYADSMHLNSALSN
jgi:hypothetical protein